MTANFSELGVFYTKINIPSLLEFAYTSNYNKINKDLNMKRVIICQVVLHSLLSAG